MMRNNKTFFFLLWIFVLFLRIMYSQTVILYVDNSNGTPTTPYRTEADAATSIETAYDEIGNIVGANDLTTYGSNFIIYIKIIIKVCLIFCNYWRRIIINRIFYRIYSTIICT